MPGDRKPVTPEELRALLDSLDQVMADAEALRRDVNRQLSSDRKSQQQTLSPASHRARGRRPSGEG
jgi:hypothetical protein